MISIVIPLYNKEKSVRATLESVRAQSFTDWECIVVDDGSTDNSLKVVQEFVRNDRMSRAKALNEPLLLNDDRFKILSKLNGGVCSARNRGIEAAKGEFVALLDGDDLWDEEYLAEQVKMIKDFPEAAMWGINYAETNNGQIVRRVPTALPDGYRGYVENYFQMPGRVSDLFCSSSVVIRREVFDKVGMFDERIKYAEDGDMWFRIIATHKVAFYDSYKVFYQWDAENRAMRKPRELRYFLPYFVGKYQTPVFKANPIFYRWINRWSANRIRVYYFEGGEQSKKDAREAVKGLDYNVLPFKYRILFKWPFGIAKLLYQIDKIYHKI